MHEPVQTSHVEQMVNKEADVEGGGDDTEFDVDNLGKELHWRSHLKKDAESTAPCRNQAHLVPRGRTATCRSSYSYSFQ